MNEQQIQAIKDLIEFRDWIKTLPYHLASVSRRNPTELSEAILRELAKDRPDTWACIRRECLWAFGKFPFERVNWDTFEDWDKPELKDKKAWLEERGIYCTNFDYRIDMAGFPKWAETCIFRAGLLIHDIVTSCNVFINNMELDYGKKREGTTEGQAPNPEG